MASRVADRSPDGQGGDAPKDDWRPAGPDRRSEVEPGKSEPEKAKTEIAAGDVADDLADFA